MTELYTHHFPNLNLNVREDGQVLNFRGWTIGSTNAHNLYCKVKSSHTNRFYYVHRLIALAFVPNPDPVHFVQVDHIDGNCMNNHVENLRWLSRTLNNFAARATNATLNRRWNKWRSRVRFNGRDVDLGWHPTQKSASRISHAFKEVAFNMLYLSGLTNEQRQEEGNRQYLRANKASLTVAIDLLHSRIRGSRTVRKQIRRLLSDFPFAATLLRFEKLVDQ